MAKKPSTTQTDFRFDTRAAAYDNGPEGRLSQRFYRLLQHTVSLPNGAALLDVGCGTGALLRRLATGRPITAHGIDIEENMLQVAQKNCPGMDIRLSPCDATPFADSTFDVLTACMAFHHFAQKDAFAKEAWRILKPGGTLYIADPCFPLAVRKPLNTAPRLHNVVGEFLPANELFAIFARQGFCPAGSAKDAHAQVVALQKPA